MSRLAWITSLSSCLAFVMTSLTVTSRLSLLWLLRLYKYEQMHPATWYMIVLILVVTPHVTHLVYIVWDTPILNSANRRREFPACWSIALGVLSSILEGAALTIFAGEVAPVLPEQVLLTLPYAVIAVSVISDVFASDDKIKWKATDSVPCSSSRFLSLCLGIYQFLAPLVTAILLCTGSHFRMDLPESTSLVICMMVLSGVWSPIIKKDTIKSRSSIAKCAMVELVYVPIKIITCFAAVFVSLHCKFGDFRFDAEGFLWNASGELKNGYIIAPAVMCLFSTFLGMLMTIASSKLGLTTAGMKIPFFLCPFLAVACSVAIWHDFQTNAFWELSGDDFASWSTIVLANLIWIIPFVFPVLKLMKSPIKNGRSFSDNFISFSWDVFFLEPRTILNYVSDSFNYSKSTGRDEPFPETKDTEMSNPKTKTVFLCTTMYKESLHEMERYVNSIKDTFVNKQDPTVNIEAHILFDGAIEDGKLNVKARQLLFLLCDKVGLEYQQLLHTVTPYGFQVNTGSLIQHTVFIHFKDGLQVKSKKRWSQVMYLNYVLQYKCGQTIMVKTKNQDTVKHSKLVPLDFSNGSIDKLNENLINKESVDENAIDYAVCSLPDIDMFQIQVEYTRLKRKLSQTIEDRNKPVISIVSNYPVFSRNNQEHQSKVFANSNISRPDDADSIIKNRLMKTKEWNCYNGGNCVENESIGGGCSLPRNAREANRPNSLDDKIRSNGTSLDEVFVLATDADTAFSAKSVMEVLSQCQSNPMLGAVCGRTDPIGSPKPIVWYQKFEYAKDFWLVKASQNVIGSVTCCPGCFSLYRGSALMDVIQEFSQPTASGFDSLVKDHGEDRWLCTLLMKKGWRLAYSAHAHNSTHCPDTVGEFLRQRRRWVLSELSNMLSIFINIPQLVRNNTSFSGMFLLSLFMTFLWIVLSPSTTLVFLCAGGHILFSVPVTFTLPFAVMLFFGYITVCCFLSQTHQKIASLFMTVSMAATILILSVGFVIYVVGTVQRDLNTLGFVEFRPYFLVVLLILATVYAAVLHPRESLSLVYGFSYALLFPSIFILLPVYSLTNMVDQSWGTREPWSRKCCQNIEEDVEENAYEDYQIQAIDHASPGHDHLRSEEHRFWEELKNNVIGTKVNIGMSPLDVSLNLAKLRRTSVFLLLITNCVWFVVLSLLYVYASSDVICYCVASVFGLSHVVQLIGLSCYRINSWIDRYLSNHDVKKLKVVTC